MKLRLILPLSLLFILSIWSCQQQVVAPESEQEQISGAYQALNFFGNRTTYPDTEIPENAYFNAWKQHLQLNSLKGGGDPMPWESMGPHNRGGRTLTLEFNPQNANTLWIGTASGGLWRSYTEGLGAEAWEYIDTGHPVLGVSSIAFAPGDSTTMYIGTGEVYNYQAAGTGAAYRNTRGSYGIGILKSTDGGQSWAPSLDWRYDQNRGIWAIKVDPQNANTVFAATTHGVYKSTDAGTNWTQVLDRAMANDLVIHPNNSDIIVAGVGNLGSPSGGIYRTTNGGDSWIQVTRNTFPDFQGKIQLNYAPSQPDILYASVGNGFGFDDGASWLYRSNNFGGVWTLMNQEDYSRWQGWFAHDLDVSSDDPDELVVVGIEAWRTTDGGQTLEFEAGGGIGPLNADPGDNTASDQVHSDCHDVKWHPSDPNIVYVASDGGIHRSTDGGQTYSFANGGLQNCQFYNGFSNAVQVDTFCLGGLQDNGTITWNGDNTWTVISGGDGSWSAINPDTPSVFYTSSQNLFVSRYRPSEGFINMDIPRSSTAFIAPYQLCPSNGDIIYAASGIVAKSTDGGDIWEETAGGEQLNFGNPVLSMAVSTNPDVVYCATAPTTIFGGIRGGVFMTDDGGTSWQDITGPLPDRYPMDMAVDLTDEATAYITYSGFGTGHVFKTTDYGDTWNDITGTLPDIPTNAVIVDPVFPKHVYVGNDFGVYVSTDGGSSWSSYQDGLPTAVMAFDLTISPPNRKLRIATHGNGAYQRDLLEEVVGTDELAHIIPVLQLSPNPASHTTLLTFDLTEKQPLSMRLVDGSGRVVEERSSLVYPAGTHRIKWSVQGVPSGIYYLQLVSPRGTLTEPLVVQ